MLKMTKRFMVRRISTLVLAAALLSLCALPAFALDSAQSSEFESITDAYMEKVLTNYHVAGASVSVVKDGSILFNKGYGYADLENGVAVDGETTAFQIASVTKLFTATAAMQMVEQGKLDLDADVNQYLQAFQIENKFQTPVTLRHLLTHTSGLDERMPLYIQSDGDILFDDIEPLEATFKKYLPPVTREPGTYCQYNVMGMALVGYIVEITSGIPFEQYVTQKILEPLGMQYSSYGLTEAILPNASRSYRYSKGEFSQGGYTLNSNHPSGAILASAKDMANFILANLDGKGTLLSAETLNEMHAHQYPADSRLTGYALGFFETIRNGHRTIEHGGALPRFSSKLTLLPEQGIGMFIALNTDSPESGKVCNEYVDLFYKHFSDYTSFDSETIDFDMDAAAISGNYTLEGYGMTDPTKIKSQLMTAQVNCDKSGNLHYVGELKLDFHYVGNGMFYSPESGNYCQARLQNGEWILNILGSDHSKVNAGERILFFVFLSTQPLFIGMLLLQIIFLIRRKQTPTGRIAAAASLLDVLYLAATASMPILTTTGNTGPLLTTILPAFPIICWLFLLASVALVVFVARAWRLKLHRAAGRVAYTVFCAVTLIDLLFIIMMNGLG